MASRTTALLITASMAAAVVVALLPATASATKYVVGGDKQGWALEVDYNTWASKVTLYVGDILEFKYNTATPFPHNVVVVDQASFNACTLPSNPFTVNSGDDLIILYNPGQYYFFSSMNSDCQSGMKLNVNVAQQGSVSDGPTAGPTPGPTAA